MARGSVLVVSLGLAGCRFHEDAPAALVDVGADLGADLGAVETRCDRAGGYAKIETAMRALPDALASDCRVGARFSSLAPDRRTHLAECMALQLGSILACTRNGARMKYPATDAVGVLCRDMRGAHRGMGVATNEAEVFVAHVVALLRFAEVPEAELTLVRDLLDFQRRDIVERDGGTSDTGGADACPLPAGDAGSD